MDKKDLRFRVLQEHDYQCALCHEPITEDLAIHEWLIKRNAIPPRHQEHIFQPINSVPLHNASCHLPKGQTKQATVQCFVSKVMAGYTPMEMVQWYLHLRHDIALRGCHSLPLLPPPTDPNDIPYNNGEHYFRHIGWKLLSMPDDKHTNLMIQYGRAADRLLAHITGLSGVCRDPIIVTCNGGKICL